MRVEIHPNVGDPLIANAWRSSFVGWWVTSIDGWYGTPAPREDAISASGRDGDIWPSRLTQGKRVVTIGFYASFKSSVEAERMCSRLGNLCGQRVKLVVEDAGGAKWAYGFVSGDTNASFALNETEFSFSLTITCPDSHKYGTPLAFRPSGNTVIVRNQGTAPTWPTIRASDVTAITISFSGHSFKWKGTAQSLVIDLRKPSATSGVIESDDAFSVPPGRSNLSISTDASSCIVEICPAWR